MISDQEHLLYYNSTKQQFLGESSTDTEIIALKNSIILGEYFRDVLMELGYT